MTVYHTLRSRRGRLGLAVAAALFASVLLPTAAYAETKGGLEGKGYKCVVVATDFWECTKDGSPTYWCDKSSCEVKPFRTKVRASQLESQGYKTQMVAPDWWVLTETGFATYWCSSDSCSIAP
jgi:hypothetical protein